MLRVVEYRALDTYGVVMLLCPHLTLAAALYLSYKDMAGPARTVTET